MRQCHYSKLDNNIQKDVGSIENAKLEISEGKLNPIKSNLGKHRVLHLQIVM